MNKKISIILAIVLIGSLVLPACGSTASTPASAAIPAAITQAPAATVVPATQPAATGKPIIAAALPILDNPMMVNIQNSLKDAFGKDYDVEISSAEGNATTQATQVQNYIAMHAKLIFTIPVEASSLVPVLVSARKAGILVFLAGGNPGNEDAFDSVAELNEFLVGEFEAFMAKQWVDQTYPNAAAGSVETVIMTETDNPNSVHRLTGIKMITEPYMKDVDGNYIDANGKVTTEANKVANPTYSSKVKVVGTAEALELDQGLSAMQTFLVSNPQVKLVLSVNSDPAIGASQAIVDEFNKGAGTSVVADLSKVATFGAGDFGNEGQTILDSITNKSVFRGTLRWGDGPPWEKDVESIKAVLAGNAPKHFWDSIYYVSIINGQIMATKSPNGEYFAVPTAAPVQEQVHQ